ncbi:MAG: hypothetical protein WED07_16580 [Candidatus Freyarchaeum deiterrae]
MDEVDLAVSENYFMGVYGILSVSIERFLSETTRKGVTVINGKQVDSISDKTFSGGKRKKK